MKKVIFFLLLSSVLLSSVRRLDDAETNKLEITYVANAGFLIATPRHKILIDALFGNIGGTGLDQPGEPLLKRMINARPPFDDIDVLLVSHFHSDHFDGGRVAEFLNKSPGTVMICPAQVHDVLKQTGNDNMISHRLRVAGMAVGSETILTLSGLNIIAMRVHHGSFFGTDPETGTRHDRNRDVENLCFGIESGKFRIFHSGNGSADDYDIFKGFDFFRQGEIKVALLDRTFLSRSGQKIIDEIMKPKNLVLMHIRPDRMSEYLSIANRFDGVFIFPRQLEKKIF